MAGLSAKLTSLVKADPSLIPYTLTSLGAGLPPTGHGDSVGFVRRVQDLRSQIAQICGPLLLLAQLDRVRQRQQEKLEDALLEVGEKLLAAKLFQQSSVQLFLTRLAREKPAIIQRHLQDKNPLVRWLTASVIGHRHLHLEAGLIKLLSDPHPAVREEAHKALVRVTRGTDFGPARGASHKGISRSTERWRQWVALQQSESSETLAKEAAVAAVGQQPKPAALDIVPLVLAHDDHPTLSSSVTRASDELVHAKGDEQIAALARLRDAKDSDSIDALVLAIPQLSGDIQDQTRDALTTRLTRLPAAALRDKLQDDRMEVRCAAALACGRNIARQHIPDLLQLLDDPEMDVIQSARVALTELTGEDFGPSRDADRPKQVEAIAAWRAWWKQHPNTKP